MGRRPDRNQGNSDLLHATRLVGLQKLTNIKNKNLHGEKIPECWKRVTYSGNWAIPCSAVGKVSEE